MCIILPVSHIPCTHTVSIWQHCINATRSGASGMKPCWNVRQHERAILTRKLCEDCGGQRFFTRRGGVAERGDGSPPVTPENLEKPVEDDADDSGYHSDVIHEEDEGSDVDDRPLSPRAIAPQPQWKPTQRKRNSSNHRSLTRKPSWKPNLKRDFSVEDASGRRTSIESMLSAFDDKVWDTAKMQPALTDKRTDGRDLRTLQVPQVRSPEPRKGRESTLLHPSSPPPAETGNAQVARSYPFPQLIHVRSSSNASSTGPSRKRSTLLHPSSPTPDPPIADYFAQSQNFITTIESTPVHKRPALPTRRESSLLRPSRPVDTHSSPASYRTIISIPPQSLNIPADRPATLSRPRTSPPARPLIPQRRMPPLHTMSEPQSNTMARQRRASVLHSCLSDEEDEGSQSKFENVRFRLGAFGFEHEDEGFVGEEERAGDAGREEAEGKLMAGTARAARRGRRGCVY
jgi:hypothetical protein